MSDPDASASGHQPPYEITLHLTARDPEVRTIEALMICIEQLPSSDRARVLDYINDRYQGAS